MNVNVRVSTLIAWAGMAVGWSCIGGGVGGGGSGGGYMASAPAGVDPVLSHAGTWSRVCSTLILGTVAPCIASCGGGGDGGGDDGNCAMVVKVLKVVGIKEVGLITIVGGGGSESCGSVS